MRLALVALTLVIASPAKAQNAESRYAASYFLAGFRIRASVVCPGDPKAMVKHAFASVSSPEFRNFSRGFPETVKRWMGEGASTFNTGVMQDGIGAACAQARR